VTANRPLVGVIALALTACTRTSQDADAKAPEHALFRPAPAPGAPDVPWSKKTRDQRMEYMGLYVYPKMRTLFRTFNAEAYKNFRCQTCHGNDMEAVRYKMPNGLYALPAEGAERAALDYDERTATFMIESVLPALRELLSKNETGPVPVFACRNCHPTE